MTIIEFVHLQLLNDQTSTSSDILTAIPSCVSTMSSASGHPSIFLSDLTDKSKMYVIGEWPSQEAHQEKFNGSKEQAELIEGIKELMEITWMEYVAVHIKQLGDIMERKFLVVVIAECGDLKGSAEARRGVEQAIKQNVQGRVVTGWNSKKNEKESEDDFLVVFAGQQKENEAHDMGVQIRREVQKAEGVKKADVFEMQRVDVEGNGKLK